MTGIPQDVFKAVGEFIRSYVSDRRARLVLIIALALMALAGLAGYFGNTEKAVEAIGVTFIFLYIALFVLAISAAVVLVGNQRTSEELATAKSIQRNARGSLLLVAGLGIVIIAIVDVMILPVWSNLLFELQYQRLKFGNIDTTAFFKGIELPGAPTVQDVEDSQMGDDRISNARAFLRLFARDVITVKNLDIRNYRGDAVIAAREVVFDNFSSIKMGNKNLFIFANTLQLANGRSGAPIYAYALDDVPSELGLEPGRAGRDGASAGSVTIVVLDNVEGQGSLTLDLRGQRGGKGARGLQPDPRPQAASLSAAPGRPKWSFRKPEETDLRKFDGYVDDQLEDPAVDNGTKDLLSKNKAALDSCYGAQSNCKLILCDEIDWGDFARGRPGDPGEPGRKGGIGGLAGQPGSVKVYFNKAKPDLRKALADKIRWSNDEPIDHEPPRQATSDGGDAGLPGLGGAGGQGLAGDPFGVCQSGASGEPGPIGPKGAPGDHGPLPQAGSSATLTPLSLF